MLGLSVGATPAGAAEGEGREERAGRAAPRDDRRMSESEKRKVEDDSSDDDEPIGKKLKVCAHTRMRPISLFIIAQRKSRWV
jgi:hypothetical protein